MWKKLVFLMVLGLIPACASKQTASMESKEAIQSRLENMVGKAQKSDLVESFGSPDWCREKPGGGENCHFTRSLGEKWTGPKKYQTRRKLFDKVDAVFSPSGQLQSYTVKSQR